MKFERTIKQYDVYGTVYEVCRPTNNQRDGYLAQLNEKDEAEHSECLYDFTASLGLPKDVAKDMELEHYLAIVNDLMPSQGN